MNNLSTVVFLINDDVRAVKVSYAPVVERDTKPGIYTFKTFDQSIEVDDYVVIPTATRHKMTVGKVEEVDIEIPFDDNIEYKWIVGKVDVEHYKQTLEQEKEAISAVHSAERRRKKEELRKSLFEDHQEQMKALALTNIGNDDVIEKGDS